MLESPGGTKSIISKIQGYNCDFIRNEFGYNRESLLNKKRNMIVIMREGLVK